MLGVVITPLLVVGSEAVVGALAEGLDAGVWAEGVVAEDFGVATLDGAAAGEETVGAVEGEAGDTAFGDWIGDALVVPVFGKSEGASFEEAEVINPKTKAKQRIALNRPILSAGCY